jgi:hypothetical protein
MARARGGLRWLAISCWLAAIACGGNAAGGGAPKDAGGDAPPEGGASALSCQEIRVRVRSCSSEVDQPCVNDIVAMGTPAAQVAFRALAECTAPHCSTGDFYCTCEQRCFGEGNCLSETEACVAGAADEVCDVLCH